MRPARSASGARLCIGSWNIITASAEPQSEWILMGTFYTKCKIENVADRDKSFVVSKLLVDTGSVYTWAPAKHLEKIGVDRGKEDVVFVLAKQQQIRRSHRLII